MLTLNIGFSADSVKVNYHIVGLKLSYLLSDQFRMSGDLAFMLDVKQALMEMKTKGKIEFALANDADCEEEEKETFHFMLRVLKETNKIKSKSSEQMVSIKKAENAINKYFEIVLEEYMQKFNATGIPALKDFIGNPRFAMYLVKYPDTEILKPDSNLFSEILRLDFPEYELRNPIVLFLNDNLFNVSFDEAYPDIVPPENEMTDKGFITPLLGFNNVNIFSLPDLDSIRNEVKNSLQSFQQIFDGFISLKSEPSAAFNYLQNELKAAASSLQNELDNCDRIKSCKQIGHFTVANIQLFAGMLPWDTIYKYFIFTDALLGDSAAVIEKNPLTGLMPVLIMKTNEAKNNYKGSMQSVPADNNEMTTLKKSLDL